MRIKINLTSNRDIVLPMHYNHGLQALIYNNINKELSDFLHNRGYTVQGRTFKLFVYSSIYGNYKLDKNNNRIIFKPPVCFYISSPIEEFVKSATNTMLMNGKMDLLGNEITLTELGIENDKIKTCNIIVQTLSPVTAYSTLTDKEGKGYTCYFMPREPKFKAIINENLRKKCAALGINPGEEELACSPIGAEHYKILKYKGFIIKGYMGKLSLSGNKALMQMALDAGLGGKNSQGFGLVKVV